MNVPRGDSSDVCQGGGWGGITGGLGVGIGSPAQKTPVIHYRGLYRLRKKRGHENQFLGLCPVQEDKKNVRERRQGGGGCFFRKGGSFLLLLMVFEAYGG